MAENARKVGPGLYLRGNQLETDIPEMLRHFGWPDTEENRQTLLEAAQDAMRKLWPGVPQVTAVCLHEWRQSAGVWRCRRCGVQRANPEA